MPAAPRLPLRRLPPPAPRIEWHKGAAGGPACMGGGGRDAAAPAAAVWRSAADARMWAAAIYARAMSKANRQGWAAKAESEDAVRRAAEAAGQAVDPRKGVDAVAMGRALDAIRQGASAMRRASVAFRRSSRLSRAAAAEHSEAAAAYGHAADGMHGQLASGLAEKTSTNSRGSAMLSRRMRLGARLLGEQADRWAAGASRWREDGYGIGADMGAMEPMLAGMMDEAGRECAESMEQARRAVDDERMTADLRRNMAAEAERSAAAAARERGLPEAQEAAEAWRRAMAAAGRAEKAAAKVL